MASIDAQYTSIALNDSQFWWWKWTLKGTYVTAVRLGISDENFEVFSTILDHSESLLKGDRDRQRHFQSMNRAARFMLCFVYKLGTLRLASARWQKKFRVSADSFQVSRYPRNLETSYFLEYLFNHRWTVSIGFHSSSFWVSKNQTWWVAKFPVFIGFQRLPTGRRRNPWKLKCQSTDASSASRSLPSSSRWFGHAHRIENIGQVYFWQAEHLPACFWGPSPWHRCDVTITEII